MPQPCARWLVLALSIAIWVLSAPVVAIAVESTSSAQAALPTAVRLEDDELGIAFAGAWQSVWNPDASGQSYRVSSTTGSTVSATFEGERVGVVGQRGPDRGRMRILVDGVAVAEVDTYEAVASGQWLIWQSDLLAPGTHTVAVEVAGPSASSPSANGVVIDAFEITGAPIQVAASGTFVAEKDARLARIGEWWVSKRSAARGGRGLRSKKKGASITVSFRGTGVTWFGLKDGHGGLADVYLDGRKVTTVSQYSVVARDQAITYSVSGLANGTHDLTVKVLGRKGAGGGSKVDVDGFLVAGTPAKAYVPTPFRYPWKTYIVVDKSEYRLYWVKNGHLIKSYPIAHGKVGWRTPSRVWRVGTKYKTAPRGVYGPRKLRLFKRVNGRFVFTHYGIHGTNQEWVIGTRASHGCIRMYNKDVRELWPQVPLGTMVVTRD